MKIAAILLGAAIAFAAAPQAQVRRVPRKSLDRSLEDLPPTVLLDAVVTTQDGRPVTDLQASDFVILQDDSPHEAARARYVDALHPVEGPVPLFWPDPFLPGPAGRPVVFIVDDLHLSRRSASAVRGWLTNYVNAMKPGDSAAILRTSSGTGALEKFTSGRRTLFAAIAGGTLSSPPSSALARGPAFSVGTLGTLRSALGGLHNLYGRKSVVLFTEDPGPPPGASYQEILDAACRAFVVLYVVDPRGPSTTFTAEPLPNSPAPVLRATRSGEQLEPVMARLARETGGMLLDNLSTALEQILTDRDGYYILDYEPPSRAFEQYSKARLFREVAVKVTRPGLHVRSRNGLVPQETPGTAALDTASAELGRALNSPFATGDLRFAMTPLFFHDPKSGPYLQIMIHLDARDLTFIRTAEGVRRCLFNLLATTWGESAEAVDHVGHTFSAQMPEQEYQRAIRDGMSCLLRLQVRRPGAYRVRVALGDEFGGRFGSASRFVEVPDFASHRLLLSGIILQSERNQSGGANRVFHPGEKVTYTYDIYNLGVAEDRHSEAGIVVRIFQDGVPVFSTQESTLTIPAGSEPGHRVVSASISLGDRLPTGDYVLQVLVQDKLASPAVETTQSIDFTVGH
jgi:VWFA-related protein